MTSGQSFMLISKYAKHERKNEDISFLIIYFADTVFQSK